MTSELIDRVVMTSFLAAVASILGMVAASIGDANIWSIWAKRICVVLLGLSVWALFGSVLIGVWQ
jgi:hypothetical protein